MKCYRPRDLTDQVPGPLSLTPAYAKFKYLIDKGMITANVLSTIVGQVDGSGSAMEELLLSRGIPRHELLHCVSTYYGFPFLEYDEDLMCPDKVLERLDKVNHLQKSTVNAAFC